MQTSNCREPLECSNTNGQYECVCPDGFETRILNDGIACHGIRSPKIETLNLCAYRFVCLLYFLFFGSLWGFFPTQIMWLLQLNCLFSSQTHTHTHTHTRTHTYIHTYIHTCIHIYLRTYIHTYIRTYIHTYTHTYIHTYIHTYVDLHTFIHTHVHTYVDACVYTYIHTYIDTHACAHPYIHTFTCIH